MYEAVHEEKRGTKAHPRNEAASRSKLETIANSCSARREEQEGEDSEQLLSALATTANSHEQRVGDAGADAEAEADKERRREEARRDESRRRHLSRARKNGLETRSNARRRLRRCS